MVHHRDAVRQRERLGLVVRHVHERDAGLLLQVDELDLHLLAQLGVECGERLVEQQHRRLGDQRARDGHALALAARQLVRKAPAEALQADVLQRLGDAARDVARRRLRHLQREGDIAVHAHVGKQRVALEHGAHRARLGRAVGEIDPVEEDLARVGQVEAGDHPQQRGLAAAGWAQQGEELARLDGEVDTVDGGEITEPARHVAEFEQRHRAPGSEGFSTRNCIRNPADGRRPDFCMPPSGGGVGGAPPTVVAMPMS